MYVYIYIYIRLRVYIGLRVYRVFFKVQWDFLSLPRPAHVGLAQNEKRQGLGFRVLETRRGSRVLCV